MRGSRSRPTYANVVATVALFVALGGTALATHPGGQNTIGSGDIIDQQVRTQDIRDEAVTGPQLAPGSVNAAKIVNGQVKVDEVGTGAVRTDEIANRQVQAEDLAPGVTPGASGARAWGLVHFNGDLLRSKNATAVPSDVSGIYCIDPGPGINPNTAVMVVGQELESGLTSVEADDVSHAEWDSTPVFCPAGTMEVQTFGGFGSPATGGETDQGGFALGGFNQGFTFVIP